MFSRALQRRLTFGLPTVLGIGRRGWFIPHRYAASVRAPARYAALEPLFAAAEPAMRAWLAGLAGLSADLAALRGPAPAPHFGQAWFPRLDAATAYAMVRLRKPARIVEIGSGHSTRFVAHAIADGGLSTRLTAIDPAPRADISALPLSLERRPLQDVDPGLFDRLGPGDFLMIDSSHVLMPGSDVDLVLSGILPRLPAGVAVQFHDIFLPDGYPPEWEWRGYNEQQGLVGWLAGGRGRLLMSSHYAATRLPDAVAAAVGGLPLPAGAIESALWLEMR
jgi:hypothetical protein